MVLHFFINSRIERVTILKKRLAAFISAIALLASGAASMGCFWFLMDEPKTKATFKD